ncbi:hypothetical protein RE421_09000 [Citricoccus sp. I39-566]|nr:hypothetical protein [Citricoccus sp. I39-566]WMY77016.1 hypothetical protein RE421_09000 [Citricoccus sp. I39-566]
MLQVVRHDLPVVELPPLPLIGESLPDVRQRVRGLGAVRIQGVLRPFAPAGAGVTHRLGIQDTALAGQHVLAAREPLLREPLLGAAGLGVLAGLLQGGGDEVQGVRVDPTVSERLGQDGEGRASLVSGELGDRWLGRPGPPDPPARLRPRDAQGPDHPVRGVAEGAGAAGDAEHRFSEAAVLHGLSGVTGQGRVDRREDPAQILHLPVDDRQ